MKRARLLQNQRAFDGSRPLFASLLFYVLSQDGTLKWVIDYDVTRWDQHAPPEIRLHPATRVPLIALPSLFDNSSSRDFTTSLSIFYLTPLPLPGFQTLILTSTMTEHIPYPLFE